jgi:hypothetical protein
MTDLSRVAFLPLDIDVGPIDFDALEAYQNEFSNRERTNLGDNKHGVYVFGLSPVMFRGDENDFYDQQIADQDFRNRYDLTLGEPKFTHDFDKKFPSLAKALKELPITLTRVELISNKRDAVPHFDDWEIDGIVDPAWNILTTRTEEQKKQIPDWDVPLNSFKIWIYEKEMPSFYVCEDLISEPKYGRFYKQVYPTCITKLTYPHGVTYQPGLRKYVLSIWGIIDRERHRELIERSYQVNQQYAVEF